MLYSLVPEINRHFGENFHDAPVEFEGVYFEMPQSKEWIRLDFAHEAATQESETGVLRVLCFSTSPTLAYLLADKVKSFLDYTEIGSAIFGIGKGDGLGAVDYKNEIYQTAVLFDIEAVSVHCGRTTT